MRQISLLAHNVRSTHNVGSLLRTAEGLGAFVYLTGYTPYPWYDGDTRLPHETQKLTKQITKTALGAEARTIWQHREDVASLINNLKADGFTIAALEQSTESLPLPTYKAPEKIAILLGREVEGIEPALLALCDVHLEIPMFGAKESFNVVQAAAMAAYHCRFYHA